MAGSRWGGNRWCKQLPGRSVLAWLKVSVYSKWFVPCRLTQWHIYRQTVFDWLYYQLSQAKPKWSIFVFICTFVTWREHWPMSAGLYKENFRRILMLVQVQVLVLDLSGPNIASVRSRNIFWTRLGPCAAFALLVLFISYKPHFTSATKKKVIDVTAHTGRISQVNEW